MIYPLILYQIAFHMHPGSVYTLVGKFKRGAGNPVATQEVGQAACHALRLLRDQVSTQTRAAVKGLKLSM